MSNIIFTHVAALYLSDASKLQLNSIIPVSCDTQSIQMYYYMWDTINVG